MLTPDQLKFQNRIIAWGREQSSLRAMLLTSTLAIPNGYSDVLSDFDVILVVDDILPYHASREWLSALGTVLALYRDPMGDSFGFPSSGYVVQFDHFNKIDFTLWTPDILRKITTLTALPEELDAGYTVLLDKDGLTTSLLPPTLQGYIPKPPLKGEYIEHIENFLLDATYVAKFLYRGDLIAAHHILDEMMKQEALRPMLEWRMEMENDWSLKPGPYMRRIQTWLRPDLLTRLEQTYTGLDPAATWNALYHTITLMHTVAVEVGQYLGFPYPDAMERQIRDHIQKVQQMSFH